MSVPKFKRNESQLFVFDKARSVVTAILKALQECLFVYHEQNYELSFIQQKLFDREIEFLQNDCHELLRNILHANAIYPTSLEELNERRIYQDKAIGDCHSIQSDIISIVDVNKNAMKHLLHLANEIQQVEPLIKKWRKTGKKILNGKHSVQSQNPGNFCNVNNNGNANNNNANNTNGGVRPDLIQPAPIFGEKN